MITTYFAHLDGDPASPGRVCEAFRRLVGAKGVAMTVEYLSDRRTTLYTTDEVVAEIDGLQEVLGEGPGVDAASHDELVVAPLASPSATTRWPHLCAAVTRRFGEVVLYAVPTGVDEQTSGIVTFYLDGSQAPLEPVENVAVLAEAVGAILQADARRYRSDAQGPGGPWDSRSVVHQATGMVMAQTNFSPQDALCVLRSCAYVADTSLDDVAQQVVDRTITFQHALTDGD